MNKDGIMPLRELREPTPEAQEAAYGPGCRGAGGCESRDGEQQLQKLTKVWLDPRRVVSKVTPQGNSAYGCKFVFVKISGDAFVSHGLVKASEAVGRALC